MTGSADARLVEAVLAGDEPAVELALADGADPDVTPNRFRGPILAEAVRAGRLGIVTLLVNAGAGLGPDRFSATPLRVAVLEAHADVTRFLIAQGALAVEPVNRSSVLTEAVSCTVHRPSPSAFATLRVLLEAAATVGPAEEQPLIAAVTRCAAPEVLRVLLACGADADQRRCDGTPAIVVAARRGDHAAVDVLVQAGADVDARDGKGRTALMHAVERNEQRVIAALLLAGADAGAESADGMTALRLAKGWQRQNVELMLGERRVGLDDVPIIRTTVRIGRTGVRLMSDPALLSLLANVVDIALDDLGDDEWSVRTGTDAQTARAVAERLREEPVPAAGASWYHLDATAGEFDAVRSALAELAYGTTRIMPAGVSRLEVSDLLEEINRQLGR